MESAFYFLGCIVLLFGGCLLGLRLLESIQKRKSEKYQTNLHRFLSNLYQLQQFWLEAGEIGYAESLGNLIKFHASSEVKPKIGDASLPLTNEAASTLIQLNKLKKDAIKEALEEIETEFQG